MRAHDCQVDMYVEGGYGNAYKYRLTHKDNKGFWYGVPVSEAALEHSVATNRAVNMPRAIDVDRCQPCVDEFELWVRTTRRQKGLTDNG